MIDQSKQLHGQFECMSVSSDGSRLYTGFGKEWADVEDIRSLWVIRQCNDWIKVRQKVQLAKGSRLRWVSSDGYIITVDAPSKPVS